MSALLVSSVIISLDSEAGMDSRREVVGAEVGMFKVSFDVYDEIAS